MTKKAKTEKVPDEIVIIECSFCYNTYDWNRTSQPDGFGYCGCRKSRFLKSLGKDQQFRVRKEHRKREPGYVIVMRGDGVWQELHGPHWQENPNGWKPGPAEIPKKKA